MHPTIAEILRDHVSLSIACIDRLYVNGYLPRLQTSGQLCYFLGEHLGYPIPSPALLRPIHDRFVREVEEFAESAAVPLVAFRRGERKDLVAARHRARFAGDDGVVFIGVAQERCRSFRATKRKTPRGSVSFEFSRQSVFVNHYYFYVHDLEWGPAFLKIGSYVPYPVKLCLNGHEWVKQQLRHEGLAFESLDNGFLSCEDPERLQALCDQLGPDDLQAFFDRWSHRLPWPLSPEDRAAGFEHRLSLWQVEMSLTHVFDRPVQGRHFFEQVIRDHLDLGRPEQVSLLFPQRLTRRTPPPPAGYRTRVITTGVQPSLHVAYKRSHVKQYFKEQRALRTETTINEPTDFFLTKGLHQLPTLRDIGQRINRTLLEVERTSEHCVLSQDQLDRLQQPTRVDTQRVPALRFGDPRVMALLAALCLFRLLPDGFRHRDLRADVATLLGLNLDTYPPGRMTYDLRRLRLKGLIERLPGTHRYRLTPLGLRAAYFYTKLHLRILRPAWAALAPRPDPIPRPLRLAFDRVDAEITRLVDQAHLQPAA